MEAYKGLEGALLRMERLRQKKGQKEICYGICVPSYLSKIEHGSVRPDAQILAALYARLGIRYEDDEKTLAKLERQLREYFRRLEYHLDARAVYEALKPADQTLRYSRCAIDWLLIRSFEEESGTALLQALTDRLDGRQLGWYSILRYWEQPESREGYEAARRANELLGNAFSLDCFCSACLLQGEYAAIHRMESRAVAVSVEEGNTYCLASYFFHKGNAYACLQMEQMMMDCYQRGLHLLQNTAWQEALWIVYYNIGATYLGLQKYELAIGWLDRALKRPVEGRAALYKKRDRIAALHKKALALARSGQRQQAREFLLDMKEALLRDGPCMETDYLKYQEALMECEEGFLEKEEYLALMERLIAALKRDRHFGHLYFYKDIILEVYQKQRRYKKALDFEREISAQLLKSSL